MFAVVPRIGAPLELHAARSARLLPALLLGAVVSTLSASAHAAPPSPAPADEAGWIELHPKAGADVPDQLRAAVAAREPKSRLPVAFLTASWCGP